MNSSQETRELVPNKFPRVAYNKPRGDQSETTTPGSPTTTLTTRSSTASVWLPTSSETPYLLQQKSDEKRLAIKHELTTGPGEDDHLRKDEDLHIPTSTSRSAPRSRSRSRRRSSHFVFTSKFVDHYFSDPLFSTALEDTLFGKGKNLNEFKASSGWDSWPSPDTTPGFSEKNVTAAFVKFTNTIIDRLGLGDTRVAVDRQQVPIRTRDGGFLKPDVFVWATGSGAYPRMEGKPLPKSSPSKKRKHDKSSNAPDEVPPPVDWPWCLIPIEVKTEKARNFSQDYLQLGTYVREVFVAQSNRRFVPSLLLTEQFLELLLWDRAGVFASERVNYRQNFDLFCLVISSILKWEPARVGFDPTVTYHEATPHNPSLMTIETEVQAGVMSVTRKAKYIVEELLLRPYTISGRGSTFWRAHKEGNTQDHYLILDSWIEGGCNGQRDTYAKLKESEAQGLIEVIAVYDVQSSVGHDGMNIEHPDDTEHIRAGEEYLKNGLNLVHTRAVLRCDAVSLGSWFDAEELITTLRDAVEAHKRLYIQSKILHRDIVPWNIVIIRPSLTEPGGKELRGGLIDFARATSIEPGTVVRQVEQASGSTWFMSQFVLNEPTSTHLDDLESFYWILFSILCMEVETQTGQSSPNQMRSLMSSRYGPHVGQLKQNHFLGPLKIGEVDDSLKPVVQLLKDLHLFCRASAGRIWSTENETVKDIPPDPEEDYREFIGHFTTAIKRISSALDSHKITDGNAKARDRPSRTTSWTDTVSTPRIAYIAGRSEGPKFNNSTQDLMP